MDFGIALEKMKQGSRVFRRSKQDIAYGIARSGNDKMFAAFFRSGVVVGTSFNGDDLLSEDWDVFIGWNDD